MENITKTLKITRISRNEIGAVLKTEWDVRGSWFERGRQVWGLVPKNSKEAMSFFSVVEAQNFADEIGASFVGLGK